MCAGLCRKICDRLTIGVNVVEACPFEEQFTACDIKFYNSGQYCATSWHEIRELRTLNDGIHNPLLVITRSPGSQVTRDRLIDLD